MSAIAEEGRLSENLQISPLPEEAAAIDLHIETVLTARDGERIIGSGPGMLSDTALGRHTFPKVPDEILLLRAASMTEADRFRAGDTFVQDGARLGWRNKRADLCTVLFTTIGVQRQPTGIEVVSSSV